MIEPPPKQPAPQPIQQSVQPPPYREPTASPLYTPTDPYGSAPTNSFQPRYYIALAKPTITYVMIALNLIAFVIEIIWGIRQYGDWNGSQNITVLVDLGAKVNEFIALQGEVWRLFTAMFLHIGILHLLFNLYALYAIGTLVESYYGHWRYAVIYLVGGLFGSLGSYYFSESVSAGASGAIFAITGAAAVYFFLYRENFGAPVGRAVLQNIVIVIVINLVFGMAGQGVDNWGHIGGLVGGVLLGWGLAPRYEADPYAPASHEMPLAMGIQQRRAVEFGWILICVLLLVAGTYWRTAQIVQHSLPLFGT